MASNGVDPATGAKKFPNSDALDIGVDLEEVDAHAVALGTRPMGTTAQRNAYVGKRKGLLFRDLETGFTYEYDGTSWVPVFGDSGWVKLTMSTGWTGVPGYEPEVCWLNGDVRLRGLADRSVGASFNSIGVVPAGTNVKLRPGGAGADTYVGMAVMSVLTDGSAYSGALSLAHASGILAAPLSYASGTANPSRIALMGGWKGA